MRVEVADRQQALPCPEAEIRRVLEVGLEQEEFDAELSIVLVDDAGIRELNRRFLGRRGVTDVLAFPYREGDDCVTGEILVNTEQALREARDRPHDATDELLLYVVHGLLHLLGYDDHDPQDARRMREREQEVLRAAGRQVEY